MAKTNFENLKSLLKAYPEARPTTPTKPAAALDSLTPPPALDRHRRKCKICRHPDRIDIERDFLRWRSLREIASSFGIADPTSIWRHACATGLRYQRQRRIAYALHPILEQAEDTFLKPTPSAIISAVRTYSQINDEGRRLRSKPVTKIYYVNEPAPRRGPTSHASPVTSRVSGFVCSNPDIKKSNRNIQELEDDSTH